MDKIIEVSCTIISSLLGLAYPIIIQIASNDKFSSEVLNKLFEKNLAKRVFEWFLVISLVVLAINVIGFERSVDWGSKLNWLIGNSADGLLLFTTTVLIISFFLMVQYVIILYRPSKLVDHLISKKDDVIQNSDFTSFEGLKDILIWAIKNDDTLLIKKLTKYFYDVFNIFRVNHKNKYSDQELIYPQAYYLFVDEITQKVFKTKIENPYIESFVMGGALLLGEFETPKISTQTYSWNWRLILHAVHYKNFDIILEQWKSASQYYRLNLDIITPEYSFNDDTLVVLNQKEITQRENERKSFYNFYTVVGALLFSEKQYHLLSRIFFYSQSLPPEYPLFPYSMSKLFETFIQFSDSNDYDNDPFLDIRFPFPNQDGVNADQAIKLLICKYLAVLFVRQFNIGSYYMYNDPIAYPSFPESHKSKIVWEKCLKQLDSLVDEVTKEDNILNNLGLKFEEKHSNYIKDYIINLIKAKEVGLANAPIELDLKQKFFVSSKDILSKHFSLYQKLNNSSSKVNNTDFDVVWLYGNHFLQQKEAFIPDSGIHFINYDTFLAEQIANLYSNQINRFLAYYSNFKYVIKEVDLYSCLSHLNTNENHIIISIGKFNFLAYAQRNRFTNLNNSKFENTEIVNIPYDRFLQNIIVIMHKNDLPFIEYNKIDDDEKDLFKLEPLIPEMEVYSTVTNIIDNKRLFEIASKQTNKSLNEFAWQGINFKHSISWKKSRISILIEIESNIDYQNQITDYKTIPPFIKHE